MDWVQPLLGVIFALGMGILGSRWFNSSPNTWERIAMGTLAMLLFFPIALYFSNRLLGWQVSLPTLLILFFLFLIIGKVSKNLR